MTNLTFNNHPKFVSTLASDYDINISDKDIIEHIKQEGMDNLSEAYVSLVFDRVQKIIKAKILNDEALEEIMVDSIVNNMDSRFYVDCKLINSRADINKILDNKINEFELNRLETTKTAKAEVVASLLARFNIVNHEAVMFLNSNRRLFKLRTNFNCGSVKFIFPDNSFLILNNVN